MASSSSSKNKTTSTMDKHIDGAKRNGPYVQYADEILDIENAFAEQSISKLSQEEVLKLNEFMKMTFEWIDSTNPKIVVSPMQTTTPSFIRFLRARKFDVKAAFAQFSKYLIWRHEEKIDDHLMNFPEETNNTFLATTPTLYRGYDREGRPLYIEKTGSFNMADILNVLTAQNIVERHIWHLEIMQRKFIAHSLELGKLIEKQSIVFDLKGMTFKFDGAKGLPLFKKTLDIDQNYYPERLGRFFFINTPMVFMIFWKIIRPWLDPVTAEKFQLLGSDYEETLHKFIDPVELPPELGGTAPWNLPGFKELHEITWEDWHDWPELPRRSTWKGPLPNNSNNNNNTNNSNGHINTTTTTTTSSSSKQTNYSPVVSNSMSTNATTFTQTPKSESRGGVARLLRKNSSLTKKSASSRDLTSNSEKPKKQQFNLNANNETESSEDEIQLATHQKAASRASKLKKTQSSVAIISSGSSSATKPKLAFISDGTPSPPSNPKQYSRKAPTPTSSFRVLEKESAPTSGSSVDLKKPTSVKAPSPTNSESNLSPNLLTSSNSDENLTITQRMSTPERQRLLNKQGTSKFKMTKKSSTSSIANETPNTQQPTQKTPRTSRPTSRNSSPVPTKRTSRNSSPAAPSKKSSSRNPSRNGSPVRPQSRSSRNSSPIRNTAATPSTQRSSRQPSPVKTSQKSSRPSSPARGRPASPTRSRSSSRSQISQPVILKRTNTDNSKEQTQTQTQTTQKKEPKQRLKISNTSPINETNATTHTIAPNPNRINQVHFDPMQSLHHAQEENLNVTGAFWAMCSLLLSIAYFAYFFFYAQH